MIRLRKRRRNVPKWREWAEAALIALLLLFILRTFGFQTYVIRSSSMYGSLLPGDIVLVNKTVYGARFPGSAFSNFRVWGLGETARNDIVCFNYPNDETESISSKAVVIKRCIGLPGDSVEIWRRQVFVNGNKTPKPNLIGERFHVRSKSDDPAALFNSLDIILGGRISNQNDWLITATDSAAKLLEANEDIYFIQEWDKPTPADEAFIFPYSENHRWSADNFGPLYIPKEGDTLKLNAENLPLYRSVIEKFEGHTVGLNEDDRVLIDGRVANGYVVGRNYYFVLGDNRHDSSDSRFWGFVPENHLIGKVSTILFSYSGNEDDGTRWHRFMTSIE